MILENKYRKIKWLLVKNPTKSNLSFVHENFAIANEDLAACLPPLQRPRLSRRDNYIFMILQFPYYNRQTREIRSSEVDFFIGRNLLITANDGQLAPLLELFDSLEDNPKIVSKNTKDDLGNLLYEILNKQLLYLFPMLNHMSQDLDNIEAQILSDLPSRKQTIADILNSKRNVVAFRKTTQSHKDIISRLINLENIYFTSRKLKSYFSSLITQTIEVWTTLEHYQDTIDALQETYESLVGFQTNQIMKTLTIFAVIVFPLTLLAAIFGMNAMNMPLVSHPQGFWMIIGIMLLGVLFMWRYFKYKKWI